ncbi:MAG: phosphodiester glycosidase family protein [Pseudorhodobacter sp.]|nr:phosphodiester glycosidase family protein [Pseudorhodobacter sp.]
MATAAKTSPRLALALVLALLPGVAQAACRDMVFETQGYTVCEVSAGEDLRLFHSAPDGTPFASFERVNAALASTGQHLEFAMNAGMYHPDRSPVGLLIENRLQRAPLVTRTGPGNFGLLPNGVFCVSKRFAVIESRAFKSASPKCRHATQSGPLLVAGGHLHPRLRPNSASRYIRNGVGVSADGRLAVFAISQTPVNLAQFARLFRDGLGLPDALYFDGNVSRLYAPEIGRNDPGRPMGPIIGTVVALP